MRTRRGSDLWSGTLGDMLSMFKVGDVVRPVTSKNMFTGVVRHICKKAHKVWVAWGGGSTVQHDPDEIQLVPFADSTIRGRYASRRSTLSAEATDLHSFSGADVVASNPPEDQYVGDPKTHGLEEPRGGGFTIMQNLQKDLHDEATEQAKTSPLIDTTRSAGLTGRRTRGQVARFEEDKPADPTKDMSPEDAKKWHEMNDKHGDKFKKGAESDMSDPQQRSMSLLKRKGFRYVSDFWTGDEFTMVMELKKGPMRYNAEIEPDGTVNGKKVEEFLRGIQSSDQHGDEFKKAAIEKDTQTEIGDLVKEFANRQWHDVDEAVHELAWDYAERNSKPPSSELANAYLQSFLVEFERGLKERKGRKISSSGQHGDKFKKAVRKEVVFFRPGSDAVFATMRDAEGAFDMFKKGRWDFEVDGKRYEAGDWRGREAIEKLFGESIHIKPASDLRSRRGNR